MRRLVLLACLGLAGCLSSSQKPDAAVPPQPICPEAVKDLSSYSPAFQAQVAREMRAATGASWPRFVSDYVLKRQQIRALCK